MRLINCDQECIVTKLRCMLMRADALATFLEAVGHGRRSGEGAIVVA